VAPTAKVAAVQAAYVLMDQQATLAKATAMLERAAAEGAEIVVFPEVFIPGTPIWFD
jgi:nitrilase